MKEICVIKKDEDKTIKLVESNHTKYIQKELKYYDKDLYTKLQEMNNPYIPKIYVIQEKDHTLTLIEEYIEGETLEGKIFPLKQAKNILHQLCLCLKPIHKMNIIHRDIKPENIIYHNGKVTLLDFGIARIQDENKSKDTQILGSIGYAAPEQFGFNQSNPQTDIYALGKLYNILLNGTLDNLEGIPKTSQLVIKKACQLDYKNRYKNVSELDAALFNRYFIFPGINNEKTKTKIYCWIYILLSISIAISQQKSSSFKYTLTNQIAIFLLMYTTLWIFFNKNLFEKCSKKISWPLTYIIVWLILLMIEISILSFIEGIF